MKTALVTGAARGIGLATCKTFLSEGYQVLMVDIDEPELETALKGLPSNQRQHAQTLIVDVSDPDQVSAMAAKLQSDGVELHALVNNAGVADFGPIKDTDFQTWRKIMATNLDGPFLVSQACLPLMAKSTTSSASAIVNIASISGLRASTLRVAYGTSKAAIIHLSQQQAVEFGELGIRVNTVAPGPVDTKLALAVHTPEIRKAYHDAIPLNRYGNEQEIANVICFLCSDKASYITGQLIAVDGGFESTGIGLPALRT